MSISLNRNAIALGWIGVVIGSFTLSGSPLTFSNGWIVLFGAIAPAAIWVILSKAPRITLAEAIAEELGPAHRARIE